MIGAAVVRDLIAEEHREVVDLTAPVKLVCPSGVVSQFSPMSSRPY